MRRTFTRAALILTVAASTAAAQDAGVARPDFSGKWVQESASANAGQTQGSAPPSLSALGDMGSGWPPDVSISRDASTLTVELGYFQPRDVQPPVRLTYGLDGRESRNEINLGRGPQAQVARVVLRGPSLIITTTHTFIDPRSGTSLPVEVIQTLTPTSPDTMMIETLRPAVLGGKASTTRTTYRRRG